MPSVNEIDDQVCETVFESPKSPTSVGPSSEKISLDARALSVPPDSDRLVLIMVLTFEFSEIALFRTTGNSVVSGGVILLDVVELEEVSVEESTVDIACECEVLDFDDDDNVNDEEDNEADDGENEGIVGNGRVAICADFVVLSCEAIVSRDSVFEETREGNWLERTASCGFAEVIGSVPGV